MSGPTGYQERLTSTKGSDRTTESVCDQNAISGHQDSFLFRFAVFSDSLHAMSGRKAPERRILHIVSMSGACKISAIV